MKFKALFFGLFTCTTVHAATLEPQKGVEILFINGVDIEEQRSIQDVDSGEVQLVLKYSQKLGSGNSGKVFDSPAFIVTFTMPDEGATVAAPKVYSYEAAKREFKSNPEWVISQSDKVISYDQEKFPIQSGLLPSWKMDEQLAEYNTEHGIVFGESAALVASAQVIEKQSATTTAVKTTNLEQLQGWYLKASIAERKEFRKWMIDQE